MSALTLSAANTIMQAGLAEAAAAGMKPLAIVVLDAGGHVKAFQRSDGASNLRFEIACGKAYGCVSLGIGGRAVNAMAEARLHFMQGLSGVSGGKIIPVPGGVLIRDSNNAIIGAVGVTGDTSDNDEKAAVAGIKAAGLTPDTGA
jgi:uncharacterized protein GlcG (DUF336 family)